MKPLTCFFFVPGISDKFQSGGLLVTRTLAELIKKIPGVDGKVVTTHETSAESMTPQDAFKYAKDHDSLFIVTWGPLVGDHIKLIRKNLPQARILYYAQSFGWNIKVPKDIPIACVSRYVMINWQQNTSGNFCTYLPPPLSPKCKLENRPRDIDILLHTRKQNSYCLNKLLPALKKENLKIEVLDSWIPQEEFFTLLNRSKIFLYITALHRAGLFRKLPGEGFGLPALEAAVCGAIVGSNLSGGVTDFLTPGENCIKFQDGNLNFDVTQIKKTLENFSVNEAASNDLAKQYSQDSVQLKWQGLLELLTTNSKI